MRQPRADRAHLSPRRRQQHDLGGAGGGIWGKTRDKGFKDADLKKIGEGLEPGTSAIIAIAEDRVVSRLPAGIQGYQNIARHAVSAEAAAAIVAEADETPTS